MIIVCRDRLGIKRGKSENTESVEMSGDPGLSLSNLVTTSNSHHSSGSAFNHIKITVASNCAKFTTWQALFYLLYVCVWTVSSQPPQDIDTKNSVIIIAHFYRRGN